jgi:hypothetical protein
MADDLSVSRPTPAEGAPGVSPAPPGGVPSRDDTGRRTPARRPRRPAPARRAPEPAPSAGSRDEGETPSERHLDMLV